MPRRVRQVIFVVVSLLMLFLAWSGVADGIHQLSPSETRWQMAQTFTQFAFGFFALLSVVTTFRARHLNILMLAGWTISLTLAAGLASVVWGGASTAVGFVSGAATFLVALGLAWLLRYASRRHDVVTPVTPRSATTP